MLQPSYDECNEELLTLVQSLALWRLQLNWKPQASPFYFSKQKQMNLIDITIQLIVFVSVPLWHSKAMYFCWGHIVRVGWHVCKFEWLRIRQLWHWLIGLLALAVGVADLAACLACRIIGETRLMHPKFQLWMTRCPEQPLWRWINRVPFPLSKSSTFKDTEQHLHNLLTDTVRKN